MRGRVVRILLDKRDIANGVLPEHNKGAIFSVLDEFRRSSDRWARETGLTLDDLEAQGELQDVLAELDEALDCVREHGTGDDRPHLYLMSESNRTLALLGGRLIRDIEQR